MRITREIERQYERQLERAGLPLSLADPLRRIALTLHRWDEEECNGTIVMDEDNEKAQRAYNLNGPGPIGYYSIPNRYDGALKRLAKLLPPGYRYEVQGDPRGWPLTITAPDGGEVSPPPFSR